MDVLEQTPEIESRDLTDNSNLENSGPSLDDNSDASKNEPENNGSNNEPDNGFTDLETANITYKELQKKLGEQGLELGNLRKQSEELNSLKERHSKFLHSLGFNSLEEFENRQREIQYAEDVSNFEVNQYLNYINEAEFPDEVKNLLCFIIHLRMKIKDRF